MSNNQIAIRKSIQEIWRQVNGLDENSELIATEEEWKFLETLYCKEN